MVCDFQFCSDQGIFFTSVICGRTVVFYLNISTNTIQPCYYTLHVCVAAIILFMSVLPLLYSSCLCCRYYTLHVCVAAIILFMSVLPFIFVIVCGILKCNQFYARFFNRLYTCIYIGDPIN